MPYYTSLPINYQLRKDIIISYEDLSYLPRKKNPKEPKQDKVPKQKENEFTDSSKKRMKKIIDKWNYYITNQYNTKKTKILFITLTISDTINTKIDHKKLFKNYIEKIQYTIGNFNYISKIEFQENGNIHWHIMQDKEVDWKIVRGIWNKTQIEYVNGYQKKMLKKYKNGFFFDTEMKTKSGEIIDYETQLKRYKIGTKANWRNPNSTDVKTINENEYDQIGSYINKYLNKKEEDKNIHQIKIDRYWTCNKELTNLKYITINEDQLKYEEQHLIFLNQNKIIYNEKKQPTCKLHSRIISETIETIERTAVTQTIEELTQKTAITEDHKKRIEKKQLQYEKTVNQTTEIF